MSALALALTVLAASASIEAEHPSADAPRVTVYGYPLATAAMLGRGTFQGEWAIDLPLGASIRLTDATRLDVELLWMGLGTTYRQSLAGWALSVAAGPSFDLIAGLYLDFHARFTLYHSVYNGLIACPPTVVCAAAGEGPIDLGPGRTRAFTAEFDLGYRWQLGRLYLSPAIGLGVGYAYDYDDPTGVGLLTPFSRRTTATNRKQGIVWTANINLLRLGVAL